MAWSVPDTAIVWQQLLLPTMAPDGICRRIHGSIA
jgi:hypothetical protein